MARTSIRQLQSLWAGKDMLLKLVIINGAVFALLHIADIVCLIAGVPDAQLPAAVLRWVQLPGDGALLLRRPWTLLTYMFVQYDVLHVLFNMLWLYWFGAIYMALCGNGRRLLAIYLYGGLGGAAAYLAACNFLPPQMGYNGALIGSSAAVIAVVTVTAILLPDYKMNLLLIGSVSLKWVALVTIGIDLISVTGANAGGHIAHLGGALTGLLCAVGMKNGWFSVTAPFDRLSDLRHHRSRRRRMAAFKAWRPSRPTEEGEAARPAVSASDQAELDRILDKMKQSGYTSLTYKEKQRLFDVSRRIK